MIPALRPLAKSVGANLVGATFLAATFLMAAAPAHSATPTDPQIAHIAYTAGDIDVKAAKLALSKSKNKDVIAFANNMLSDHQAVDDKALALVKKLKVTPEDNDTSKALVKQAAAEREKLSKLSGAAFDKAYAANELAFHETVDGALKDTLIPNAKNPELKDLLSTGLKIFQGHQEHAQMLVNELK